MSLHFFIPAISLVVLPSLLGYASNKLVVEPFVFEHCFFWRSLVYLILVSLVVMGASCLALMAKTIDLQTFLASACLGVGFQFRTIEIFLDYLED